MSRQWIPFEVGMAKALNKRATIITFGLRIEEVSNSPFQQFQNIADSEQQLIKLVNELLIRYIQDAKPSEQEIRRKVRDFTGLLPPTQFSRGIANDVVSTRLIEGSLETTCRALSVPSNATETAIRAFVFQHEAESNKLICTHCWSAEPTQGLESVTDFPKSDRFAQYAIWRAFESAKPVLQEVDPEQQVKTATEKGVDSGLNQVLAAPIHINGRIWGVIDFDTKTEKGSIILRSKFAAETLIALAEHVGKILSLKSENII
jgi:hypothetical protein